MNDVIHRSPSVGSLVKKIIEVNPELSAKQVIGLVRQATYTPPITEGDYMSLEVVDEALALELARKTVNS